MKTVAITGRSGSGKSTVAAYFAAEGYSVLDADSVARQVTQKGSPCLVQLAKAFGADILDADGALLRKELAARAFSSPENTKKLTDITHPAIVAQLLEGVQQAKNAGASLVFVDGAVIVGGAFEPYCDKFIVVISPVQDALSRIVLRDGISKQAARDRLSAQLPEQDLLAKADFILENTTTPQALREKAQAVLRQL